MYSPRFKEMFERIYDYAQTMELPAAEHGSCKYRSINGPCLVGYVISDGEALAAGYYNFAVGMGYNAMPSLDWMNVEERYMMSQIQNAHDSCIEMTPSDWKHNMMCNLNRLKEHIYA